MYDCPVLHAPLPQKFTGKERDSESGNDNFAARYYSSSLGRFTSPDPENAGASPASPQSWNAYSYVLNNPLNLTDPNGLWCVWEDGTHDDNVVGGGASPQDCANQQGHWDPSETILGLYARGGNIIGADTIYGSVDLSLIQTVNVQAQAPFDIGTSTTTIGALEPPTPTPLIIGRDNSWMNGAQARCLGPAAKAFVGGLIMKKEIDALASPILGSPNAIEGPVGVGPATVGAEVGLDKFAESRAAVNAVRSALGEEGHRIAAATIRKAARFGGRVALGAHVAFAFGDAREAYNACTEN